MVEFNEKSRTRKKEYKEKNTFESANAPYESQELILNAFRSKIFPIKSRKWFQNINS